MPATNRIQQFLTRRKDLLLYVFLFAFVFAVVSTFQTRNLLPTSETLAPALSAPLLRGGNYDLAAVGERPVLVYFFAPWCKICAVSSDNLVRLRQLRDDDALEILAVALDWQDRDKVREYVERHDLNLPVLLGDSLIAKDWRVVGFPTYYVLDSHRQIHRRDFGYSTQFGLWWRTWFVD